MIIFKIILAILISLAIMSPIFLEYLRLWNLIKEFNKKIKIMSRLNAEQQHELEPQRVEYAKEKIKALGYDIIMECESRIEFLFKGERVMLYPYSGWHTGKSITDGRGLFKLIKQIKLTQN